MTLKNCTWSDRFHLRKSIAIFLVGTGRMMSGHWQHLSLTDEEDVWIDDMTRHW